MNVISKWLQKCASKLERYSYYHKTREFHKRVGSLPENCDFRLPDVCFYPEKIFLDENTSIFENSKFIISEKGEKGKFIFKKYSYAAQGLTVITGNHPRQIGQWNRASSESRKYDVDTDVIVEEDVGIGANVTLLAGAHIGRGATIGAGSVCSTKIPPYAIVMGNPAQVVGFVYTPQEIVEHEKSLYPEEERLPLSKLEKNYQKYYLNHLRHIAGYTNLTMLPKE